MKKRYMTPATAEKVRAKRGIGTPSKLKQIRIEKGFSQNDLAAISGIPKSTIERFEQDPVQINNTKLSTICSICIALGCHIEEIIESDELIRKYRVIK